MKKTEFNKQIKNIDFVKFEKEDKAFADDVIKLKDAINEPKAPEIDPESEAIINAFFKGVQEHLSHLWKGTKETVKKIANSFNDAIDGLKVMLEMASTDKEKKSYNDAIQGLEVMAELT